MKALVKQEAAPGIWLEDVPEPEVGPNDVLIEIAQDRDLRHRHAHLQLGRLGAEDHPGADGRRPRVRAAHRRDRLAKCSGFKIGDRVSGEGHITCGYCRNCRAGRRHLCRNTVGVGVNRPGAFAEYLVDPGRQRLQAAGRDLRRHRLDPRSVRQRHAHRARLQPGRRGRADHRRRPDRHHGGRDRAPRRRAPRRDHRRQRLPARARAQDGRDARGQRAARVARSRR